jgi:hypothetical protein
MIVMTEERYLSINDASRQDYGDCAMHKNIKQDRNKEIMIKRMVEKGHALTEKRARLREEYRKKCEAGEMRPPTRIEQLIENANAHEDHEATLAARRLLEKKGIDWRNYIL